MPNENPNQEAFREALRQMFPEIAPDAATAADNRNPRRRREEPEIDVGVLTRPEPRHELDLLVLHDAAKSDILAGLRAIELRADMERVWGINAIQPQAGRCILNFYGAPGTGKTRAALAIALRLGKPLYQVDYSAIISKYLGDTAKHIAAAFAKAKELGAVLFFDEADSLLSRRVDMGESCATSINQNRNVLMQELDRFDGVVIMTTTARVESLNQQRSVNVQLLSGDDQVWVSAGSVSIPPNKAVPATGAVVEIRYLYAFRESGVLYQPVYLGERDDVGEEACTISQLKYKAE